MIEELGLASESLTLLNPLRTRAVEQKPLLGCFWRSWDAGRSEASAVRGAVESKGRAWERTWGLDSPASRCQGHLAEVKLLQATAFCASLVNQGNGLFTSRFWLLFHTPSLQGRRGRGGTTLAGGVTVQGLPVGAPRG